MKCCLRLLCAAAVLLLPLPAFSVCNVPQPRLICAEYFASQLVVEATLLQTRKLHDKDYPEFITAYVYTLRVNRVLRGKIGRTIDIYEGNDSGRAGFGWIPGGEYLLFLSYAATEKSWELDGCGNSGPLGEASMVLSEIARVKTAHGGGVIHGVVTEQTSLTPIPGVRVEVRGATGHHYTAVTNKGGQFQLDVPAGRYVVLGIENASAFETDVLSYEDPRYIRIQLGGCAQVQLAKVENPR